MRSKEDQWDIETLRAKACEIRRIIIEMIADTGSGHIGPALSAADLLTALFFRILHLSPPGLRDPDRDRFLLSAGHKCAALYAVLAERGLMPRESLATFLKMNSGLGGHPDARKIPAVDASTGSLGHGLPIALGMALAGKHDGKRYRVFTLLGDGELNEGSNWEAIMAASAFKLDNLVAIVDRNLLQIDGPTEDIMPLEPLRVKWEAFGWATEEVDGHEMAALVNVFERVPFRHQCPSVVIARTIKGKGVSFMEGQVSCHYRALTAEEKQTALTELAH